MTLFAIFSRVESTNWAPVFSLGKQFFQLHYPRTHGPALRSLVHSRHKHEGSTFHTLARGMLRIFPLYFIFCQRKKINSKDQMITCHELIWCVVLVFLQHPSCLLKWNGSISSIWCHFFIKSGLVRVKHGLTWPLSNRHSGFNKCQSKDSPWTAQCCPGWFTQVFHKWGYPWIIHFSRDSGFPITKHPFWGSPSFPIPIYGNPPYVHMQFEAEYAPCPIPSSSR